MSERRVGLIGFGAIGRSIAAAWAALPVPGHRLAAVLVRPAQLAEARALLGSEVALVTDIDALLTHAPDTIVEAAGHGAVSAHAERVLRHGTRLMLLSIGALADAALHERLMRAAHAGGGPLVLPVGAIAGLDGLLALRRAGLRSVVYSSTKPPLAWAGTPAERAFDLAALRDPTLIFDGSAREAASLYPKNANLAAAVALAGLGFERTTVQLFADPAANGNTGRIVAVGEGSTLEVTVAGLSSPANPKTSAIVAMSVLSSLANAGSALSFG